MIFSGRHYSALSTMYSEMFGPVPRPVAEEAASNGRAPALMDALYEATQQRRPIQDWSAFAPVSGASSARPTGPREA